VTKTPSFTGLMPPISKPFNTIFQIAWKLATLQYAYKLLMSYPLRFVIFSPVILPVYTVLSMLTIYICLGIAITAFGLVGLVAISLSGPLITIALVTIAGYGVYQTGLSINSYFFGQTTYSQCRAVMLEKMHTFKDIVSQNSVCIPDYIDNILDRASNKITDMCREVSSAQH